jgi:hypothetical protein
MTRFHSSRRMAAAAICVLAGIFLGATGSRAEDSPVKPHRKENRFLFVIDTSAAMKARTSGVVEGVMGLLDSDMKGGARVLGRPAL